jgi:hypothetical protein
MESSSGHTSTMFNKILIPVITTVLGATAIYFLGFNKKASGRTDMEQMLISKEATVKAWKSFVTSQNIGYKNIKSLSEEYVQKIVDASKQGIENSGPVWSEFKEELLRESRKGDQDIKDILKDPDIDRDFISMLNRGLTNGKDQEEKMITFFGKINSLLKSDQDATAKLAKLQTDLTAFQEKGKRDEERMVNEAEAIAKVLADKYNQAFNLNDLEAYVEIKKQKENKPVEPVNPVPNNPTPNDPAPVDPNKPANDPTIQNTNQTEPTVALLAGQWEMTGGILELSRDGDMYWTFDAKGYTSGDWQLSNGTIRMNATNPDTKNTSLIIGYISNFSRKSFTLTFNSTPREVYNFTKKVDY